MIDLPKGAVPYFLFRTNDFIYRTELMHLHGNNALITCPIKIIFSFSFKYIVCIIEMTVL